MLGLVDRRQTRTFPKLSKPCRLVNPYLLKPRTCQSRKSCQWIGKPIHPPTYHSHKIVIKRAGWALLKKGLKYHMRPMKCSHISRFDRVVFLMKIYRSLSWGHWPCKTLRRSVQCWKAELIDFYSHSFSWCHCDHVNLMGMLERENLGLLSGALIFVSWAT